MWKCGIPTSPDQQFHLVLTHEAEIVAVDQMDLRILIQGVALDEEDVFVGRLALAMAISSQGNAAPT